MTNIPFFFTLNGLINSRNFAGGKKNITLIETTTIK